mmetsp:Transcript_2622/g.3693  ORF Transcript_2622/g.3693 Transcript_2622/m.3693 type:complete len:80 (+) Transcript_2622:125-364(+)
MVFLKWPLFHLKLLVTEHPRRLLLEMVTSRLSLLVLHLGRKTPATKSGGKGRSKNETPQIACGTKGRYSAKSVGLSKYT